MLAGPEIKNFDQLKVGDKVNAQYVRALSLELKKAGEATATSGSTMGAATAPVGSKPGAAAGAQVTVVADVVAVDSKAHLVTLRGPKGNMVDLNVKDPKQLALIKVGDKVEAVYTEALAVHVEPVK
jgi:Cu/Ag efflux protein CusF